jgi:hypothetical protein
MKDLIEKQVAHRYTELGLFNIRPRLSVPFLISKKVRQNLKKHWFFKAINGS